MPAIDAARFLDRLAALGRIGRDAEGRLMRLAASDADRAGRDALAGWMREAGLEVRIDRIGNLIGLWDPTGSGAAPVMMGSHIDTVIDAGIYDGCAGVLAGLAVIEALAQAGRIPSRPLALAAFTNEEGVRYAPDMMGSLVYAGGFPVEAALATIGTDGTVLGEHRRHGRRGADGAHGRGHRAGGGVRPHPDVIHRMSRQSLLTGAIRKILKERGFQSPISSSRVSRLTVG